jgi:hypothetical protein
MRCRETTTIGTDNGKAYPTDQLISTYIALPIIWHAPLLPLTLLGKIDNIHPYKQRHTTLLAFTSSCQNNDITPSYEFHYHVTILT